MISFIATLHISVVMLINVDIKPVTKYIQLDMFTETKKTSKQHFVAC